MNLEGQKDPRPKSAVNLMSEEPRIGVVNCGISNIGSVLNMLKRLGVQGFAIDSSSQFKSTDCIILPGVGAYDSAMKRLRDRDMLGPLQDCVLGRKVPTLGICLGMQLMTENSEEGQEAGLGWIAGTTRRFPTQVVEAGLKIPHMGWNTVDFDPDKKRAVNFVERTRFYFVHSYFVEPTDPHVIVGTTRHGIDFASVVQKKNIMGVQFHPEKSHRFGLAILRYFLGMQQSC